MRRLAARSAGPSDSPCMRGLAAQISSTLATPRAVSRIAWTSSGSVSPALASSCASSRSTYWMSSGPSTLGIMMTSTTSPTSVTAVVRSSSAQGESSELTRVQSWVSGVLHFLPTSTRPARAVSLSAAGTPSSRLANRTSTVAAMSGTLATILGFDAGKKWITRDGRTGISRGGAGAPTASGRKKSFGERYPGMASDGSWARNWALQARGPRVGGLGLPCLVNRWFGRAAGGCGRNDMANPIESAWARYPDYRIDLVPTRGTARVWHGDLLLAASDRAVRLQETKHVDRLYFPEEDVRWDLFQATDHHTTCPFKGQADYWSLTAVDPAEENVVWAYRTPFPEVAGIESYVCFYQERLRVEIEERWSPDDPRAVTVNRFPTWGDAADLLGLIDVQPAGDGRFVGPPYREGSRNVVEGGQLLAQAVVAAAKAIPDQRVTSASMIFSKAASFDVPVDVSLDVLRRSRTFSTVQVRIDQAEQMRTAGLLLLDAGAPDVFRLQSPMPDVPGPYG